MTQVMTDLWPLIVPTILALVIGYISFIHKLRIEVAVLKTTVEDLLKTVDSMQKRQDSHSKKQDEIVQLITDLKVDFVKEIGSVSTGMAAMASNIDALTNLIKVTDLGIKVNRGDRIK